MALTSLAYNHHAVPASKWQSETIDEILHVGDSQCLLALQKGLIPDDAPNFSAEQLPTAVCFTRSNKTNNDLPLVAMPFVATTDSWQEPILVLPFLIEMPVEAPNIRLHNTSDFPIVERLNESPIVVNTSCKSPIVATNISCKLPIVATNTTSKEMCIGASNEKLHSESNQPGNLIVFVNNYQGTFFNDTKDYIDSPFLPLSA